MPLWDDKPVYSPGICAACGRHTEDGIARWIPRSSAADVRLIFHADLAQCTPAPARSSQPPRVSVRRPVRQPSHS